MDILLSAGDGSFLYVLPRNMIGQSTRFCSVEWRYYLVCAFVWLREGRFGEPTKSVLCVTLYHLDNLPKLGRTPTFLPRFDLVVVEH